MIWLAWRQHRKQALFTFLGLAVLAALVVPSGIAMHNAFNHGGVGACVHAISDPELALGDTCNTAFRKFNDEYAAWNAVGILLLFLPIIVGLFWGAPLVAREVEHGTHRLVWTQGVSRKRWALVKLGVVGSVTLLAAVIYGFGISWWIAPLNHSGQQTRFSDFFFDMQGLAPIGYTLFAVALGVFVGVIWPRVLPAMGVTLAGFIGFRIVMAVFARPHYLPPKTSTYPITGPIIGASRQANALSGDWVLDFGVRNAAGRLVAAHSEVVCPPNVTDCGADLGLSPTDYNWQLYQPGSRFWLFQGVETGIFVIVAAALVYFAVRRIRRIA